jgi:CheY-like chemotaxis protein
MLVDDDPVIRVLIKDYLTAFQCEVDALEGGVQCLDRLGKSRPDVLLLDFQMPVMTGMEVLKYIRSDSTLRPLPVVMLSANKDTQKLLEENGVYADRYIIKPFEMKQINEAIESVLTAKGKG